MKILAIDTSCDETTAAVTEDAKVLSNIIWSQASLHAEFGGVMPSLAQRQHEERIEWVINRTMTNAKCQMKNINAIAVTFGPGLSIALGVGINKAKELAIKYKKTLIPINHIEAHLLSPLARSKSFKYPNIQISKLNKSISLPTSHYPLLKFPAFGLVLSGGNTQFVLIKNIGDYKILAETVDDALGEALDKAARLLGLGYPGGALLEKFARSAGSGQARFKLPIPLVNDKVKNRFSYSGLKTAFVRLLKEVENPKKQEIADLAASFQNVAFEHIIKVLDYQIRTSAYSPVPSALLFGGGVSNNNEIRKRLRKLCRKHNLKLLVPYSKKLTSDNAAMIGVCAYLKNKDLNSKKLNAKYKNIDKVDRDPRAKIA